MRTKAVIALIIAAVGVLLVGLLCFSPAAPLERSVLVSFAGYTNASTGTRLAMFILSNHGHATVRRTPFCYVVSQPQSSEPQSVFTGNLFLPPGQSNTFSIPAPGTQQPWKVVLLVSREGWRNSLCGWANRSLRICASVPMYWRGVPSQHIQSEWITE